MPHIVPLLPPNQTPIDKQAGKDERQKRKCTEPVPQGTKVESPEKSSAYCKPIDIQNASDSAPWTGTAPLYLLSSDCDLRTLDSGHALTESFWSDNLIAFWVVIVPNSNGKTKKYYQNIHQIMTNYEHYRKFHRSKHMLIE